MEKIWNQLESIKERGHSCDWCKLEYEHKKESVKIMERFLNLALTYFHDFSLKDCRYNYKIIRKEILNSLDLLTIKQQIEVADIVRRLGDQLQITHDTVQPVSAIQYRECIIKYENRELTKLGVSNYAEFLTYDD
jgi:hypothetical protein